MDLYSDTTSTVARDLSRLQGKIRKALDSRGLSQKMLATELGVTQGALSRWLSAGRGLSVPTLTTICKTLGLSADELLGLPAPNARRLGREVTARLLREIDEIDHAIGEQLDRVREEVRRLGSD